MRVLKRLIICIFWKFAAEFVNIVSVISTFRVLDEMVLRRLVTAGSDVFAGSTWFWRLLSSAHLSDSSTLVVHGYTILTPSPFKVVPLAEQPVDYFTTTLSCLQSRYWFWANILYSARIWLIDSSLFQHILHASCLSMQYFILFVLGAWSCATMIKPSVDLFL